ncbi:hypothetical protein CCR96_12755 [Halochromatium roseum]|nr:hypothetical protein [Halochromatium roseum]
MHRNKKFAGRCSYPSSAFTDEAQLLALRPDLLKRAPRRLHLRSGLIPLRQGQLLPHPQISQAPFALSHRLA